jgi:pyruvate/2-oxoglutarate dehydrogenase complex dihydrolipoamide dehydrogenase (E3) component
VVVVEERDRPGGALVYAARPPGRGELWEMVEYFLAELQRLGVEIRLNTVVDERLLTQLDPAAVVLATGANPKIPEIPGLLDSGLELSTVLDVLSGNSVPGRRVVVLGSDQAAMVTADFLAQGPREVAVLGGVHFAPELAPNDRTSLRRRLADAGVRLYKQAFIREFLEGGLVVEHAGGRETLAGFRDLVIAEGFRPERRLTELLTRLGVETHIIGDAKSPRTLLELTAEADELGRAL